MTDPNFRSGFVAVVGRPNVGKSTLTNAMVGSKVAITSSRPQTTRNAIRGIVHRSDGQLVLVDTPGIHRPRTLLGERLNELVTGTLAEVDLILFCLPANETIGPGDRRIAASVAESRLPVVLSLTKADTVSRDQLARALMAATDLGEEAREGGWAAVVPTSATKGEQVDALERVLLDQLPVGPALYAAGERTDTPAQDMVAELVREAALEGVREELPHSLAVQVEEIVPRPDSHLLDVRVNLFVERPSQKAIIIGQGGSRLREVGTKARLEIEELLGQRVYLDLHVKVAKEWQRDPKQLRRLGF